MVLFYETKLESCGLCVLYTNSDTNLQCVNWILWEMFLVPLYALIETWQSNEKSTPHMYNQSWNSQNIQEEENKIIWSIFEPIKLPKEV